MHRKLSKSEKENLINYWEYIEYLSKRGKVKRSIRKKIYQKMVKNNERN